MMLAARVARSLEEGRGGLVSSALANVWGTIASRSLVKSLAFRGDRCVIAVGGATLGGSGKTPLAIACARELSAQGVRVALVGHAYRAHPLRARLVRAGDDVEVVGDEALLAARALAPFRVPVFVAPNRQAALDLALAHADVAILDGIAQLEPLRANLALLAVDSDRPWGAGACPPRGDLRAPVVELTALSDMIVRVGKTENAGARVIGEGAWLGARKLSWDEVRSHRVGLWTSIARPERVLADVVDAGVTPAFVVTHADHGEVGDRPRAAIARAARDRGVNLWVCTPKCAVSASRNRTLSLAGVPFATLEHEVELDAALKAVLAGVVTRWRPETPSRTPSPTR